MEKIQVRDTGWKKFRIWDGQIRIRDKHPGSETLDNIAGTVEEGNFELEG